ncbi:MAG: hypothetical protein CBB97_21290 [Candidatus Endolissoclinum sp. TMED37]|nr:MAG: hypothetical protein CBB97_21290 [Candidatus Endolissoclinum sp. TMED37]
MTTEINIRRTEIKVSFQKEGIHKYPGAKDLPGVEFLQYPHRHIFHFYVTMAVTHDDREVEFILFKRELESLYEGTLELDYKSCEMIAEELVTYIEREYPGRRVSVEVYEDDENGAIVSNWQ